MDTDVPSGISVAGEPDIGVSAARINEVHLINLDLSVHRLAKFFIRNPDLTGVIRASGVDGSELDKQKLVEEGIIANDLSYRSGSLGCAMSHIGLWRKGFEE